MADSGEDCATVEGSGDVKSDETKGGSTVSPDSFLILFA